MIVALYPGTFDPVTNGHLDLVHRAAKVFDRVVVAVYDRPAKPVLFTTQERAEMFRRCVPELSNVSVETFKGLVITYARKVGAQVMLRGLRAGQDFEYEWDMALMNKHMAPEIESLYMMSSVEWQFLSASRVKEVIKLGGATLGLVPAHVERALRAKLRQTTRVGKG
ncbi:MAG: pantetheine-phosphate adenylyltransferase [Dehalococcoidia bacterium]|nr:pantetheine-phosphate adenylyltransferase [Dehalococcoidia bacterium]